MQRVRQEGSVASLIWQAGVKQALKLPLCKTTTQLGGLFLGNNLWTQGEFVTRFVPVMLLAMSLPSWDVIITKALAIMCYKKIVRNASAFWHSEDVATGGKARMPRFQHA